MFEVVFKTEKGKQLWNDLKFWVGFCFGVIAVGMISWIGEIIN